MKRILNILVFLVICTAGHATHNRAGQLLYKHITGYTYEFTQTQFYYTKSQATDQRIRDGLNISWGNNIIKFPCIDVERLPDDYTKCIFQTKITFSGPHTYIITVEDPNRNEGVVNIPNSVGVVFCVQTILRITANTGINNAPDLLNHPIDKAAVGRRFVHNPSAYDSDGDSLSYELAICLRDRGIEIETYSFPNEIDADKFPEIPKELYVDPITGDFVWDAPVKKGLYNVAMKINEWRYGRNIGSIVRDMQIEVVDTDNMPPEFPALRDTCVVAGEEISFSFKVTDPDNDRIKVTATGGPYEVPVNKAAPLDTVVSPGYTNVTFTWQTDYSHVRRQPYTVVFKAEDQNADVKLVSFANYNITVIAPKVENLTAKAQKKEIQLEWDRTVCEHASGYEIYRSIGNFPFDLQPCETGIPSGTGYERVTTLNGIDNIRYLDNNNDKGLSPGIEYCYRVVAIFSDGAKSLPSDESCASLLAGTPPMIRAHVETVDVSGEIHVAWLEKPVKEVIETYLVNNPDKTGPFEYRLFYSNKDIYQWPDDPLFTTNFGIEDTIYLHKNIDTKSGRLNDNGEIEFHHYYKVELWDAGSGIIVDEDFEVASTLYPILQPSDKSAILTFGRYTPWVNAAYDIYRIFENGNMEWIMNTGNEKETIKSLKNGQEYCYRIESEGYRNIDGIEYRNTNWSHVACVTPIDNVPPCPPEIEGETICETLPRNQLNWTYDHACMYDMEKFLIYFSYNGSDYEEIASVDRHENNPFALDYSFSDYKTLIGFYYVTAVDSAGNESSKSNTFLSTPCSDYELPNVFTPNNDGFNDVFKSSYPHDGLERTVNMQIFNLWGKVVFKTNDPDINWDGRDIDSKRFVSSGVYYYIGELYEEWATGNRTIPLSGFVHVFHGDGPQQYVPPVN